jgi:hypothetical protein
VAKQSWILLKNSSMTGTLSLPMMMPSISRGFAISFS